MTDPRPIKNIYWNGGGFTGAAYYTGIMKQLLIEERTGITRIDFDNLQHFGASAGNGCMLAYELMRSDTPERQRELLGIYIDILANRAGGYFDMTEFMYDLTENGIFRQHLDKDIVAIANKSIHIGMMRHNSKTNANESFYEHEFESIADILNALLCGGNIPLVCSHEAKCRGEDCLDGGLMGITPETISHYNLSPENTIVLHPPIKFPYSIGTYPRWVFNIIREYGAMDARDTVLSQPTDEKEFKERTWQRDNILPISWMLRNFRHDSRWTDELMKWH
jgi:hypothetical protein